MALVAGLSCALDIRMMGFGAGIPLAPLEKVYPIAWLGFSINLLSGTLLLIADASTKMTSPVFYVKMFFVIAAVVILQIQRKKIFRNPMVDQEPLSRAAKYMAYASLICWIGAVTAGRLMAYLGPVSGLSE